LPTGRRTFYEAIPPPSIRMDPRVHHRFLSYRERHVYFGRDSLREPLSLSEFAALDEERKRLIALSAPTAEERARLLEVRRLMLED
jgi:hypothetical protein